MLATEDKRFYWIKLREDFFDDEVIDYIMSLKNGPVYICLYQILCLKSSNQNGMLVFTLRDRKIPYDVEKIRREAKYFDVDTIMVALDIFKSVGLIEVVEDGAMFLPRMPKMVGSEAANANAQRQKRFRERQKQTLLGDGQQLALNAQDNTTQSVTNNNGDNVTESVTENNEDIRDKRIDIRDKILENRDKILDIREQESSSDTSHTDTPENSSFSFSEFLEIYPKKVDPSKIHFVEDAWNKTAAGHELEIRTAIIENMEYNDNWKKDDGYYIPGPEKWLLNRGWEQRIEPPAAPKKQYAENDPRRFYDQGMFSGSINH